MSAPKEMKIVSSTKTVHKKRSITISVPSAPVIIPIRPDMSESLATHILKLSKAGE